MPRYLPCLWFAQGERLTFVGHTHELALVHWNGTKVEHRELVQGRITLEEGSCIVNAGSVGSLGGREQQRQIPALGHGARRG